MLPKLSEPLIAFRKLQSSGPNLEISQDHDSCQKEESDQGDSVKLVRSDQKTCNAEKLPLVPTYSSSGCDDFLADPGQCANSSQIIQSGDAPPSLDGGCLMKLDIGNARAVGLNSSTLQKSKRGAQAKSRISVRLVKNEPRHLISSSECSGALPRLLTDHASEKCQPGDSFSEVNIFYMSAFLLVHDI